MRLTFLELSVLQIIKCKFIIKLYFQALHIIHGNNLFFELWERYFQSIRCWPNSVLIKVHGKTPSAFSKSGRPVINTFENPTLSFWRNSACSLKLLFKESEGRGCSLNIIWISVCLSDLSGESSTKYHAFTYTCSHFRELIYNIVILKMVPSSLVNGNYSRSKRGVNVALS